MNKILVIAAHPDDEILGLGGTLYKYTKNNEIVRSLILGQGIMSRGLNKEKGNLLIQELKVSTELAAGEIGIKETYFSEFPDQKFDKINFLKIIQEIEKYMKIIRPDIVFTHYENDLNLDHRITFKAVVTACRPFTGFSPKKIYCFETPSSTEWQLDGECFRPNVYVDIEKEIAIKLKAIKNYNTELRTWPHPRSLKGIKVLAQYRGRECGLKFAEGFILMREII